MEVNPITLAALATSAVPGLEVTHYQPANLAASNENAVILGSSLGKLLVRVPLDSAAEVKESSERLSLTALGEGMRSALSFEAPAVLGVIGIADTRAVITTYISGKQIPGLSFTADENLIAQVAKAIAEIHSLPKRDIIEHGLTSLSVSEIKTETHRSLERAERTGLLPVSIKKRWSDILDDESLWDFHPSVVHGNLDEDQFMFENGSLTGVIGWSKMRVSDPALDLSWLTLSPLWDSSLETYFSHTQPANPEALAKRSVFWGEFQVAEWLLFGVDARNNEIINDAVAMLDQLVDAAGEEAKQEPKAEPEVDVIEVLQQTPHSRTPFNIDDDSLFDELEEDRLTSGFEDFKKPDDL